MHENSIKNVGKESCTVRRCLVAAAEKDCRVSLPEGRPLLNGLRQRHRRAEWLHSAQAVHHEDANAPDVHLEGVVEVAETVRRQVIPGGALHLVLQAQRSRHPQRLDGVPGEAGHVKVRQLALKKGEKVSVQKVVIQR